MLSSDADDVLLCIRFLVLFPFLVLVTSGELVNQHPGDDTGEPNGEHNGRGETLAIPELMS